MTPADYRNPAGLTADNISMLDKVTQKLRDKFPSIAADLMRYIIDGDEERVLEAIAGCGHELRLSGMHGQSPGLLAWPTFFRDLKSVDLGLYQRLTRVFESGGRNAPAKGFYCQDYFDNNRGLELLLQEATGMGTAAHPDGKKKVVPISLILQMLAADGRDGDAFLTAPFRGKDKDYYAYTMRNIVRSVKDLGEMYAQRRDLIAPYLRTGSAEQRVYAVENLIITATPPAPFVVELVECAVGSAKSVREAATLLLRRIPEAAMPHLERSAREGNRNEREHAVRLLGRLCGKAAQDVLKSLSENEKSEIVLEAINAQFGDATVVAQSEPLVLEAPPNAPLDLNPPVTADLRQALLDLAEMYRERAAQHAAQLAGQQKRYVHPNHPLPPLPDNWLPKLCSLLEGREELHAYLLNTFQSAGILWGEPKGSLLQLLSHPDFKLLLFVRWLVLTGALTKVDGLLHHGLGMIDTYRRLQPRPFTLNELAEAFRALGYPDQCLFEAAVRSYAQAFDWEPEAVWPFFYEHLPLLEKCFQPVAHTDYSLRWQAEAARNAAFRYVKQFPVVPPAVAGVAWELAVGSGKQDRQKAQPICEKLPDLPDRLATALVSGNFQTRQLAAEWLGRLGNPQAVPALAAAARKEKQDATLDAMLTALEKLGQSIAEFLDRDKLQADAVKKLQKGIPSALEWFPWSALPKVRWHDSGQAVPTETLTWLIVQSHKLKTSEPGALLKRYCELMRPADREELGNFTLNAWLGQDLKRKLTDDEARAQAKLQSPRHWQSMQYMIGHYQKQNQAVPASIPQSLQACEEQLFAQAQREVGSAVNDKGVLAVAGACCGDSAVGLVQHYLKEWYGYRAAQCKALIAMLSGVDRPLAIQYILSISNRFRTKSIQEEADKYIHLLAERKGWTLDELADRTMPTCGLEENGRLELNFGPRTFNARVDADLELQLYDAEGKALKKLPDPRKDDDEELAKSAKKSFSAAKTELKKFVGLTQTRLYEAMCTERTWPATDWRLYLLNHPLAKLLCRRLVWVVLHEGTVLQTFRPLDDGTLTDFADNSVTPPIDSLIRIAHACNTPAETCRTWTQHLADYEVSPLFAQFARAPYELPTERRREIGVNDFEGHLLEAFKLRSLAMKFGYSRGAAEDGGWFHEYLKSFPGLGIEVHLGFSGNGLPEENRTVALTSMTFERRQAGGESSPSRRGVNLPLKELPSVLLSECVGDLRALAAAGSGFDRDWEKKVN